MPVPQTYVVAQGDSLSLISKKMYGDYSMTDELARVNNVTNPNLIYAGQQLIIPVKPGTTDGSAAAASSGGNTSTSVTTTTYTSEVKKTIGKYFGWGILAVAAVLLAYEANKQHKKNKSGTPKAAAKLSGRPAKKGKRKKKSLKGPDEVSQIVTYMSNDEQFRTKEVSPATIDQAVKKFNREFPGEKLTLSKEDKERVLDKFGALIVLK